MHQAPVIHEKTGNELKNILLRIDTKVKCLKIRLNLRKEKNPVQSHPTSLKPYFLRHRP